jgi:hypothetical protein
MILITIFICQFKAILDIFISNNKKNIPLFIMKKLQNKNR